MCVLFALTFIWSDYGAVGRDTRFLLQSRLANELKGVSTSMGFARILVWYTYVWGSARYWEVAAARQARTT